MLLVSDPYQNSDSEEKNERWENFSNSQAQQWPTLPVLAWTERSSHFTSEESVVSYLGVPTVLCREK